MMDEMEKQQLPVEAAESSEKISLTYKIKAEEVAETLNKMDKLRGSDTKTKLFFFGLIAIAAYDAYRFITTKSGLALIFTIVFLVMAVFYKKKSDFANRRLGEAFEKDPQQILEVGENELKLTDRSTKYEDISDFHEYKKSFGMKYMGNHFFVIPKRIFESDEQLNSFRSIMQEKLEGKFYDYSENM